ncbi:hypothetical protein WA158_005215 [Blastocystis sp. Blastoise]
MFGLINYEEVHYREMKMSDVQYACDPYVEAFDQEPWCEGWEGTKGPQAFMSSLMFIPRFLGYVCTYEDRPIGWCFGWIFELGKTSVYHVELFFLAPETRGGGIGSKFMNYIKRMSKKDGADEISLWTRRSCPCFRFYLRNEFTASEDWVECSCKL